MVYESIKRLKKRLRKIFSSKNVILKLTYSDIKLRYAGSYLGVFWSLLEPFFFILTYSLIFPLILGVSFKSWFLFFITGMIPYRFIRKSILEITTCLVQYSDILEKSKTNAENIVFAKAISSLVPFLIEISIVTILVFCFVKPSIYVSLLPIVIIITFLMVLGFGFYFSVIYPGARDINYILSVILDMMMFLTPIVYRINHIPEEYRGIYLLNPFARLIYLYQGVFLYSLDFFVEYLPIIRETFILFLFSVIVFILGYRKFEKSKKGAIEMI